MFRDSKFPLGRRISIGNPVTKQQAVFPPLPVLFAVDSHSVLAYVPSTKEYKVVFSHKGDGNSSCCLVLTVHGDKLWRQINLNHIPEETLFILRFPPFSIGAFIYWANTWSRYIFALDLETEIIHQVRLPRGYRIHRGRFTKMGSFLTF